MKTTMKKIVSTLLFLFMNISLLLSLWLFRLKGISLWTRVEKKSYFVDFAILTL